MSSSNEVPKVPEFDVPLTRAPEVRDEKTQKAQIQRVAELLKANDAVLIAHYYTDPNIQALADYSGGFIGDSLAMAQYGYAVSNATLVVAGVRFMGESAKILSPKKKIIMPTLEATCSLDLGCPADLFEQFCGNYPDRTVVVYANTSAAVKAQADWVVTSSNALKIVDHLDSEGEKILWAPDRYLGDYIQKETGVDMVSWQGACVVHEEYKAQALKDLMKEHKEAAVLVHPESPPAVVALADVVGSTTRLLKASEELTNDTFIVATDRGIFYKMQQASPNKTFIEAPTAGHGATCHSCGHCPWMAMNTLDQLEQTLIRGSDEIILDEEVILKAKVALTRMLEFSK